MTPRQIGTITNLVQSSPRGVRRGPCCTAPTHREPFLGEGPTIAHRSVRLMRAFNEYHPAPTEGVYRSLPAAQLQPGRRRDRAHAVRRQPLRARARGRDRPQADRSHHARRAVDRCGVESDLQRVAPPGGPRRCPARDSRDRRTAARPRGGGGQPDHRLPFDASRGGGRRTAVPVRHARAARRCAERRAAQGEVGRGRFRRGNRAADGGQPGLRTAP